MRGSSHGGQGESLVPPHTRGSVSLSLDDVSSNIREALLGVLSLRGPVASWVQVYFCESGGGARGSRLRRRALGGIALRFAALLPRRHMTD
jgi:hypothetical protein